MRARADRQVRRDAESAPPARPPAPAAETALARPASVGSGAVRALAGAAGAEWVLGLQRAAGNRAVQALLAPASVGSTPRLQRTGKKGSLLVATGGNKTNLIALLQMIKPYEAWRLLRLLRLDDAAALLPMLERVDGHAEWLERLAGPVMAAGNIAATVARLLEQEDDVNVLLDLLAVATAAAPLVPLLPLVPDRRLLLRLLQAEPDPLRLRPLCETVIDLDLLPQLIRAAPHPLTPVLVAHEPRAATLLELLRLTTDPPQALPALLAVVADRAALAAALRIEPSCALLSPICAHVGDPAALPELLGAASDRAFLAEIVRRERTPRTALALLRQKADQRVLPELLDLVSDRTVLERARELEPTPALVTLVRAVGDPAALPGLLEACEDRALLAALLQRERDGAVLRELLGLVRAGPQLLPRLLELVGDRKALGTALGAVAGDAGALTPICEALGDRTQLAPLLKAVPDRGLLLKLLALEPQGAVLLKLANATPKTKQEGLPELLAAVEDRAAATKLVTAFHRTFELRELARIAALMKDAAVLPVVLKEPFARKPVELEELLRLEPDGDILVRLASAGLSKPKAIQQALALDDDRERLLANLGAGVDLRLLGKAYALAPEDPSLVGTLLRTCTDTRGRDQLIDTGTPAAMLIKLLEAGRPRKERTLAALLGRDPKPDRLLANLRLEPDADLLLGLYQRATVLDELGTIIANVKTHGTRLELLGAEGDTTKLVALLAVTPEPGGLLRLLKAVPDREQLRRAMASGYKGDIPDLAKSLRSDISRLGDLVTTLPDRELLLDLIRYEDSSTRLLALITAAARPRDLLTLLPVLSGKPTILLLGCLGKEKDVSTLSALLGGLDSAYDAEHLLGAVPDRPTLRALVTLERRDGLLRRLLATVPDAAVLQRLLTSMGPGHRKDLGDWLTVMPDTAVLETVLGLYAGAMDRPRLMRLLKALVHDGLAPTGIQTLLTDLAAAMAEDAVEQQVTRLRGNLGTEAAGAEATPVTTPGGEKVLSGSEIAAHAAHTRAMGRPLTGLSGAYPTGQDPTARTHDQLWQDCGIAAITHTDMNQPGHTEDPGQKLIRQKLALRALMERFPTRAELIQRIFAHGEGQTPRAFASVGAEHGYEPSSHIEDAHVLDGTGLIPDLDAVATRACLKFPACGTTASAFTSAPNANAAITGAINADLVPNWVAHRRQLVEFGVRVELAAPCAAGLGVCLRKRDAPRDAPYGHADMTGGRPLQEDGSGTGLTFPVAVTQVKVVLDLSMHPGAHGWFVFTAYPMP